MDMKNSPLATLGDADLLKTDALIDGDRIEINGLCQSHIQR